MKYTSAEANKLVRKIEEKISTLLSNEGKTSTFNAAVGEDLESVRPAYSFEETQKQLEELQEKLRIVKHAINCFNTTTELPGFGMTIDQVLICIPQLHRRKMTLGRMAGRLPKERHYIQGNIIDYEIANYEIADAQKKYEELGEKLTALQLALDEVNSSKTMEIDVVL